jgi:hypothetical protein
VEGSVLVMFGLIQSHSFEALIIFVAEYCRGLWLESARLGSSG